MSRFGRKRRNSPQKGYTTNKNAFENLKQCHSVIIFTPLSLSPGSNNHSVSVIFWSFTIPRFKNILYMCLMTTLQCHHFEFSLPCYHFYNNMHYLLECKAWKVEFMLWETAISIVNRPSLKHFIVHTSLKLGKFCITKTFNHNLVKDNLHPYGSLNHSDLYTYY